MSLATLIGADSCTVMHPGTAQQPGPLHDASGGQKRLPGYPRLQAVPIRISKATAKQKEAFAQLGIEADYVGYVFESTIQNGEWLVSSDNKTLRVVGVEEVRGIGSLPTYYELALSEWRQT